MPVQGPKGDSSDGNISEAQRDEGASHASERGSTNSAQPSAGEAFPEERNSGSPLVAESSASAELEDELHATKTGTEQGQIEDTEGCHCGQGRGDENDEEEKTFGDRQDENPEEEQTVRTSREGVELESPLEEHGECIATADVQNDFGDETKNEGDLPTTAFDALAPTLLEEVSDHDIKALEKKTPDGESGAAEEGALVQQEGAASADSPNAGASPQLKRVLVARESQETTASPALEPSPREKSKTTSAEENESCINTLRASSVSRNGRRAQARRGDHRRGVHGDPLSSPQHAGGDQKKGATGRSNGAPLRRDPVLRGSEASKRRSCGNQGTTEGRVAPGVERSCEVEKPRTAQNGDTSDKKAGAFSDRAHHQKNRRGYATRGDASKSDRAVRSPRREHPPTARERPSSKTIGKSSKKRDREGEPPSAPDRSRSRTRTRGRSVLQGANRSCRGNIAAGSHAQSEVAVGAPPTSAKVSGAFPRGDEAPRKGKHVITRARSSASRSPAARTQGSSGPKQEGSPATRLEHDVHQAQEKSAQAQLECEGSRKLVEDVGACEGDAESGGANDGESSFSDAKRKNRFGTTSRKRMRQGEDDSAGNRFDNLRFLKKRRVSPPVVVSSRNIKARGLTKAPSSSTPAKTTRTAERDTTRAGTVEKLLQTEDKKENLGTTKQRPREKKRSMSLCDLSPSSDSQGDSKRATAGPSKECSGAATSKACAPQCTPRKSRNIPVIKGGRVESTIPLRAPEETQIASTATLYNKNLEGVGTLIQPPPGITMPVKPQEKDAKRSTKQASTRDIARYELMCATGCNEEQPYGYFWIPTTKEYVKLDMRTMLPAAKAKILSDLTDEVPDHQKHIDVNDL
ncbi:unnamed protein product [Amoebophrya sp. A25]|nr:unnamed protein product [Amoebophrya sp. A25]|eukprot:GSA25T00022543001.1